MTDLLTAAGVDASKAAVVLENVLMHLLIDDGVADPVALWPRVDGAACAVGLREVGVGDPGLAERLAQALRRPLSGPPAPEALEPRILPDRLQVGAFELVRNGWVDKAWWHVASLRGPDAATVAVLSAALRYAALFSETRHIGPPQSVYDDFYAWGVRNEGFASPFNARLLGKPGTRFFSACADVDAPFGSAGSFFGHADPAMPGAWCLDPPFLTRTIRQVEARIAQWRRTPNPPTVLLIIPWSHELQDEPDESVRLTAGRHYFEGLAGTTHPLPVDVAVHRYGELPGFDGGAIQAGYAAAAR